MVKLIKVVFFPFKILMLQFKWDLTSNGNMFVEPIQSVKFFKEKCPPWAPSPPYPFKIQVEMWWNFFNVFKLVIPIPPPLPPPIKGNMQQNNPFSLFFLHVCEIWHKKLWMWLYANLGYTKAHKWLKPTNPMVNNGILL